MSRRRPTKYELQDYTDGVKEQYDWGLTTEKFLIALYSDECWNCGGQVPITKPTCKCGQKNEDYDLL